MPENPEKRKKGEKDPRGVTKRKILVYIYNNPDGIKLRDIQDFIKKESCIGEHLGIGNHLKYLEGKKYIRNKWDKGFDKFFYPPENTDSVPDLLQDNYIWGPDFKSDDGEIFTKWQNQRLESRLELYHTKFFEQTVRNEIIRRLLSSPPYLDNFKELYHLDLKTAVESEVEKEALKNLYTRAASMSLYLVMHMFVYLPVVEGALHVTQYNAQLLNHAQSEAGENQLLIDEQITKIRKTFENIRGKQDYVWEYQFTSLESFSLAIVFICLNYERQIESQNSDIVTFFQDDAIKKIFLRYIPNPFFFAEVTKFINVQTFFSDLIESHLQSL